MFDIVDDPKNAEPITALWAYISVDRDGNEGICAAGIAGFGMTQLIFGYERVARKFLPFAEDAANQTGKTVKLMKFTAREEVLTVARTRSGYA